MKAEFEIVIKIKPGLFKKSLGIRFDMLCFFRMLEEFGITLTDDVSEISKVPYDEMLAVAIFTGAESYAFKHKKVLKFDKDQVLRWVDDSIITRGHFKQLGVLWAEFMADYTQDAKDKKKAKASR